MPKPKTGIDDFMAQLDATDAALVETTRALIKRAAPSLTEGIKWSNPSYALDGNDIITFNLRNYACVALILHTGPKGKDTKTGTRLFDDPAGLITWLADRRCAVKSPDRAFLELRKADLERLVKTWVDWATRRFGDL